ncbi:MAG: class II SORL domain-containing protein [Coriobacteriia bacterium]|nr:class II SORL domain-containing protein [Coriobacteriia bacterium]
MSDAPILSGVNLVTDLDQVTDFERKHTPYVAIDAIGEKVRVTIEVGHYVAHPNQADHFIDWIELYADDAPIARFDLSPVATDPAVSIVITLDAGTVVRAVQHCNLHGLWAAEVTL